METLGNDGNEKNEHHKCLSCNFNCKYISDWNRHIKTMKHINMSKNEGNDSPIIQHLCDKCNKEFKSHSGLWKHKKTCNFDGKDELIKLLIEQNANKISEKDEIISYLMKENNEFKNMMMEMVKNGINNTNHSHNTTNSHNKAFNLQFFLNETCKDAMNIMDFVELIKPQLSELEKIGDVGYVESITNLITTNLKALGINQRPVQCTDKKRETIYIKDENKWEKDDNNKTKLRKVIRRVADKNLKLLPEYRKKYPGYNDASSKNSNKYNRMMVEVMGGCEKDSENYENKIIHNISNFTTIEKMIE